MSSSELNNCGTPFLADKITPTTFTRNTGDPVHRFTKPGHVDHTYTDHASILKWIEWNWLLKALSLRSRDNLPNPISSPDAPYFPTNSPAIGALQTMFDFGKTVVPKKPWRASMRACCAPCGYIRRVLLASCLGM